MKTIKGPAIFLAQFAGDAAPFHGLASIARWAADLGYKGVQIPSWDGRLFDLARAAESDAYCDEVKGMLKDAGVELTELSTHLQGQLVAVHPAYDAGFDAFAAPQVRGNPKARQAWAVDQMHKAAAASQAARAGRPRDLLRRARLALRLSLAAAAGRPDRDRVRRAGQALEADPRCVRRAGVDVCYEIHPGEDLIDGVTFEMFLERVGNHPRCCINYDPSHFLLQQLDYLGFIDVYHERIKAFHVKDAEFNPSPRQGVYSGFQPWLQRAGRFRSLGDGQVDFVGIFSKLAGYDYDSWAVLEWECCLKHPEQGAAEGAPFIAEHIIQVTETAFDDFAAGGADQAANRRMLGIG